jgi:CDP-glucose 4,6-dehydratase
MGLAAALQAFYRGRRVLVTGHTGFKGAWLVMWLRRLGAKTVGVALPPTSPLSIFGAAELASDDDRLCDVRDLAALRRVFSETRPDIVFHLAAQALVGVAHREPIPTFETNLMGTANILECIRLEPGVESAVLVSSDKCYENVEQVWGYREHDRLGGWEPYGASKAAAEILASAFTRTYFEADAPPRIATARSGNVVGGGDWSEFRLIPDCVRSLRSDLPIRLRSPQSTRPWQFVLEPLAGYLMLAKRLVEEGRAFQGPWNFGPPIDGTATVLDVAEALKSAWGGGRIEQAAPESFRESTLLQLDCTKARHHLGWRSLLDFHDTIAFTAQWYAHQHATGDGSMREYSLGQIDAYEQRLDRGLPA